MPLESSITLHFSTSCLGPYTRFVLWFRWYFRGSLLPNTSSDSPYTLQNGNKDLVINNINRSQLGQYAVRFFLKRYELYEVKARVDLLQKGGRCSKSITFFVVAKMFLSCNKMHANRKSHINQKYLSEMRVTIIDFFQQNVGWKSH